MRSLETYVVDDVERHGTRLTDMLRRNRAAYRERLQVSATARGISAHELILHFQQASAAPMADDAFFRANNDLLVR